MNEIINQIEELKQMQRFPRYYLSKYFEELKTQVDTKILKNIFGDVYVCRCASLVTVEKFKIWDKLIRNYKGS